MVLYGELANHGYTFDKQHHQLAVANLFEVEANERLMRGYRKWDAAALVSICSVGMRLIMHNIFVAAVIKSRLVVNAVNHIVCVISVDVF